MITVWTLRTGKLLEHAGFLEQFTIKYRGMMFFNQGVSSKNTLYFILGTNYELRFTGFIYCGQISRCVPKDSLFSSHMMYI